MVPGLQLAAPLVDDSTRPDHRRITVPDVGQAILYYRELGYLVESSSDIGVARLVNASGKRVDLAEPGMSPA